MIKELKYIFLFCFFLSGVFFEAFGQGNSGTIEGSVSYLTGTNIYVKFNNTEGIENGDTLFQIQNENMIPVLIVQHHSSISCLCSAIDENTFQLEDRIYARTKIQETVILTPEIPENNIERDINEQVLKTPEPEKKYKQDIRGRFSASEYSNFNNGLSDNTHRFRYTFSMDANHISSSRISAETYLNFTHKLNHWDEVKNNFNNALKIYSLAVNYDIGSNAFISVHY